jgi:hypothetical protein
MRRKQRDEIVLRPEQPVRQYRRADVDVPDKPANGWEAAGKACVIAGVAFLAIGAIVGPAER